MMSTTEFMKHERQTCSLVRVFRFDWHTTIVREAVKDEIIEGRVMGDTRSPFFREIRCCKDGHVSACYTEQTYDGQRWHQRVASLLSDLPPLFTDCTAASMKGAAVPYGSRSTTSTRVLSVRWLYIKALTPPKSI